MSNKGANARLIALSSSKVMVVVGGWWREGVVMQRFVYLKLIFESTKVTSIVKTLCKTIKSVNHLDAV